MTASKFFVDLGATSSSRGKISYPPSRDGTFMTLRGGHSADAIVGTSVHPARRHWTNVPDRLLADGTPRPVNAPRVSPVL
jgi:hypothetical protein